MGGAAGHAATPPVAEPSPSASAQGSDRRRLLVLCFDPLGDTLPGPSIRAWHLAEVLAEHHDVVLASTVTATRSHPLMDVRDVSEGGLDALVDRVDAVFAPVSAVHRHPSLAAAGMPLALDMYIPTHLENLEPGPRPPGRHAEDVAHQVRVIGEDLATGDFFLCASERQRDFWMGALAAAGRVNPAVYDDDPTLRALIDVVPFGLPAAPPVPAGRVLRERFGIAPDDPVVVWGGGVYDWLDPCSAVLAVHAARDCVPAVRLVFLGMGHPTPGIPEMRAAGEVRALSERLGLTGTHVFFHEGWVPYGERGGWLLDADVGISTHLDHVETRFSFRTRLLDYLWAGLPMVVTGGDALADVVDAAGVGVAVAPGDVDGLAAAIVRLLGEGPPSRDFASVAQRFRWPAVAAPLVEWCRRPRRAPDRVAEHSRLR
ncbi:MAG: glycosyltransferase [Acidimicrobiales bacterium]